jgi:hypothetical protein
MIVVVSIEVLAFKEEISLVNKGGILLGVIKIGLIELG